MNKILIPFSGYPILKIETNENLNKDEINFIKDLKLIKHIRANTKLTKDVDILRFKELKRIKDLIWNSFCYYIENVIEIKNQFYFCNSWATIQKKGDDHPAHNHENAIFSSVYYGKTKSSSLEFYLNKSKIQEGHFLAYDVKRFNFFNSRHWSVPVKEGDILFFPGEINHGAKENKLSNERITIPTSFYFKGKTGYDGNYDSISIGNNKKYNY